jgi:hypothetical protein
MAERSNNETQHEMIRSVFGVDCSALTPKCGYRCDRCKDEMRHVIQGMRGVTAFYTKGEGEGQKVVVEHDSAKAPTKQLTKALEQLPSRLQGTFIVSSVLTTVL